MIGTPQGDGLTWGHNCLTHWYRSGGVLQQMHRRCGIGPERAMLTQAPVHDVYDRRPRLTRIPRSSATPSNGVWLLISDGIYAEPGLRLDRAKSPYQEQCYTGLCFHGPPAGEFYVGPRRQHPARWGGRSTQLMGSSFLIWNGQCSTPPREGGRGKNVVCRKLTVLQYDQSIID